MPKDLDGEKTNYENANQSLQNVGEINRIIQEAKVPGVISHISTIIDGLPEIRGSMDPDNDEFDLENEIEIFFGNGYPIC
ncbi:hypothetical protein LXL04_009460 [Taraxacum kok-saghyz]